MAPDQTIAADPAAIARAAALLRDGRGFFALGLYQVTHFVAGEEAIFGEIAFFDECRGAYDEAFAIDGIGQVEQPEEYIQGLIQADIF